MNRAFHSGRTLPYRQSTACGQDKGSVRLTQVVAWAGALLAAQEYSAMKINMSNKVPKQR